MSIAHVFSSVLIGTASVALGVWLTRKYGPKLFPSLKKDTTKFAEQAKAAKDEVSAKVQTGSRNLADVLMDIERKRESDPEP